MIDTLLNYIAPHLCYGCGKIGTLLCDNCKYNITFETNNNCVACGNVSPRNGICATCKLPYQKGWHVGERTGELKSLIDGLKFEHKKSAATFLAQLLDQCIEQLPPGTLVVPVPTIASHVRQRGYDHTRLIATYFAKLKGLRVAPVLMRATNTVQRGHSRKERLLQASQTFVLDPGFTPSDSPYLLIDDVITTGATLASAASILRANGVKTVWVAALARQPLD
jgi:ComF family protein